jgi:hypothetical protein
MKKNRYIRSGNLAVWRITLKRLLYLLESKLSPLVGYLYEIESFNKRYLIIFRDRNVEKAVFDTTDFKLARQQFGVLFMEQEEKFL